MQELLKYEFLSWFHFSIIVLVVMLTIFVLSRIHIFNKYAREKSIGFRMIVYLMIIIIVITFLLIRPVYHFLFLLVLFGLFYKNIVSYSRSLFNLYFSNVKFGDQISIGNVRGTLDGMNFGGVHLLTNDNKVYFSFDRWTNNRIVLESESGKVWVSFECSDTNERSDHQAISDLEKSLFNYPFLTVSNVNIDNEAKVYRVAVSISNPKYKGGLLDHINKAGFRINANKL